MSPLTRANNGQDVLAKHTKLYKFSIPLVDPVEDTTGAALAKGAASITVTTFASWNTGDYLIIIGSGGMDLLQLGTKPGEAGEIPLVGRPPMFAQDNGARIVKVTREDLGYVEEAGPSIAASSSKQAVGAANAGGAIAYIDADTPELTFTWGMRESNIKNILAAFGVDESAVEGTGVANDPYRALISGETIGTQANYCLRSEARKVSGKTQVYDVLNAFPEVNVSTAVVGKGNPSVWNCGVKCTAIVPWDRP